MDNTSPLDWFNILHSMAILFFSLALGSGIHEICKPSFDRNFTFSITFIPAFVFSVVNVGLEETFAALFLHILLLSMFEK